MRYRVVTVLFAAMLAMPIAAFNVKAQTGLDIKQNYVTAGIDRHLMLTFERCKDADDGYTTANLNLRVAPDIESESLTIMLSDTKIIYHPIGEGEWYQVYYKGMKGYAHSDYIVNAKDYVKPEPTRSVVSATINSNSFNNVKSNTTNATNNQFTLTRRAGRITNASGYQETYYNLPMQGVVRIMRNCGFSEREYPYWIRQDGVKMLGTYVMVAADLSLHPRGSVVRTSLGNGLVCDTGSFIYSNRHQFDIATNW